MKKLEGAGIKPTDYYWLTEDIFGLHINSSDADAFQENLIKRIGQGFMNLRQNPLLQKDPMNVGNVENMEIMILERLRQQKKNVTTVEIVFV